MKTRGMLISGIIALVVAVLFMGWKSKTKNIEVVHHYEDTLNVKVLEEQKIVRYLEKKEKMFY